MPSISEMTHFAPSPRPAATLAQAPTLSWDEGGTDRIPALTRQSRTAAGGSLSVSLIPRLADRGDHSTYLGALLQDDVLPVYQTHVRYVGSAPSALLGALFLHNLTPGLPTAGPTHSVRAHHLARLSPTLLPLQVLSQLAYSLLCSLSFSEVQLKPLWPPPG